ncbi:hypothetical protein [Persephonella sp.]
MTVGKAVTAGIVLFTLLTVASFFFLPPKYSITLALIDITMVIFAVLVWFNDRYFNEQINHRVFSIADLKFIDDVIVRQMNMHGVNRIVRKDSVIEFYRKNHKTGEVKLKVDEKGRPVVIDGKYIIEVEAPEYILHNIDHETWSLIGRK